MKKIFLSLIALVAVSVASAQVTVTFRVDMTNYVGAGGTINDTLSIAGTFGAESATAGSVTFTDWSPGQVLLANVSGNIYGTAIDFPAGSVGHALEFKFLNQGVWGTICSVQQECLPTSACAVSNDNRTFTIPAASATYTFCWDSCTKCDGTPAVGTGIKDVVKTSGFTLTPNPVVNGNTVMMYTIDARADVNVTLFNTLGQEVKTYVNNNRPAGTYNQTIDLNGFQTGVYYLRLQTGGQTVTKRLIL